MLVLIINLTLGSVYSTMTNGPWQGISSLFYERYSEKGLTETSACAMVPLVKSRNILQKPNLPKRSPPSFLQLRELGAPTHPSVYDQVRYRLI